MNFPHQKDVNNDSDQWTILAILRFFLSMVVVIGHCSQFVGGRHDWTFVGLWLNQGSAVFGFFIVSGYSIAASLDREIAHFYKRRAIRIFPLYISCIIFGLIVSMRFPNGIMWPTGIIMNSETSWSILASFLMLQTIFASVIPIVGPIWSLSPEWWHYMLAPILKKCSTVTLLALLFFSFIAFMVLQPPDGDAARFVHGLSLLTLSWLWMTGFMYFRLKRRPAGFAILVCPSIVALYFGHFTGIPLFISIFTMLLCTELKLLSKMRPFCLFLGDLSFPIYLFHFPIMALFLSFGETRTIYMVIAAIVVSAIALYLIDYRYRSSLTSRIVYSLRRLIILVSD